ncbi:MAG TPA: protein phosphatase 2C domain-containing protein [Candidatus Sericytochromatia bacterium]
MENPAATLYCSNTRCQAPNPQSNKFCQQCRTPLLRRYLWAIGRETDAYKPGDVIAGRYAVVSPSVLLETKPGMPPETPQELPQGIVPYLKLSPYGLHIPQVYGRVTLMDGRKSSEIWLLEDAPIYASSVLKGREAADTEGQLLPELASVWKDAPAMRQLNWLWQLATLWQPLSSEGVASSLFSPTLVRVEGAIVRLLELPPDLKKAPTLQQLGQLWSQWLPGVSSAIADFFQHLCSQLVEGQIRTSEELVALLDHALQDCGRSQIHTYEIFTATDKGPSRNHNEDACYPPGGQVIRVSNDANALAIVCDGIGGHEGGEVASNLAINTLQERVGKLLANSNNCDPTTLTEELELAVCAANDAISEQNDTEQRSDRQRMGTTLVMARSCAHEIYITHVGDSRVYWITRNNCHQVTQDDDLASREVRLGYALYRSAVQQPTSGSLVQALGMASSATLHPTVQRFVLDEDCIFLLCSDGLSDNDRVDQFWQSEIQPILEGRVALTTAGTRLIQIANTQNGHDNATIALVHCKVSSAKETGETQLSVPQTQPIAPAIASSGAKTVAAPSRMKTQRLASPPSARSPWGLLLGILLLLGLGGVLAYLLLPGVNELIDPLIGLGSRSASSPSPSPSASTAPTPTGVSAVEGKKLIQVSNSNPRNIEGNTIRLALRRGLLPPQNQEIVGVIPTDSILQVISEAQDRQQESWLQVSVCSAGTGISEGQQPALVKPSPERSQSTARESPSAAKSKPSPLSYLPVGQGDGGWIRKGDLLPNVDPNFAPTSAQRNECATATTPPASVPTSTSSP